MRGQGGLPRKHAPGRPWVSVRPERVCHCELAGRGQASGEKSLGAKSPEERTRVLRRRGGASKGVAVASISRRSGKQAAVSTLKVRLSALRLPSFSRGEKAKSPTR